MKLFEFGTVVKEMSFQDSSYLESWHPYAGGLDFRLYNGSDLSIDEMVGA